MEPTLQEIAEMRLGNQELIVKYLPCLLDVMEADVLSRPHARAVTERFEKFKAMLVERQFMTNGSGI